ncbi:hypothetical protein [Pseudolysobacter antarcticus]|uniref:hypothetical protein n=1 Tax=Pseudolysobacter antarcticus TaxID=2511995 RepID=UPI0013EE3849|nr:hypothetical protein [Pseudolysobacter antarcticus]
MIAPLLVDIAHQMVERARARSRWTRATARATSGLLRSAPQLVSRKSLSITTQHFK